MIGEMKCKGQFGTFEFSEADRVEYGNLKCIRYLALDKSDEASGLNAAFEEAADDCLAICEADGIETNKPLEVTAQVGCNPLSLTSREGAWTALEPVSTRNRFD